MRAIKLSLLFLLLVLMICSCKEDERIQKFRNYDNDYYIIVKSKEEKNIGVISRVKGNKDFDVGLAGAGCWLLDIKADKNNIIFYFKSTFSYPGIQEQSEETLYYKCYFSNKNLEDLLSGKERYFELIGEKYK